MGDLLKYRIPCTTEGVDKFRWIEEGVESAPTTCPADTAHTVDAGGIGVAERRKQEWPLTDAGVPYNTVMP
ncbi:MAG: hypothetical protein ACYSX0_22210, partial [Planctomycetota bacterium]